MRKNKSKPLGFFELLGIMFAVDAAIIALIFICSLIDKHTMSTIGKILQTLLPIVTIIVPVLGTIFSSRQNKIIEMKKQSNWRKKAFELEQKELDDYTYNDLFIVNSFINPYTKTNAIGYYVNKIICSIYKKNNQYKTYTRKLKNILQNKEYKLNTEHKKIISLFDMDNVKLDPKNKLNRQQAIAVKLCCHALLKAEWENQM